MSAARIRAPVIERHAYGAAVELVMEAPQLCQVEPGQFLHVYCGCEEGRILRRPYSVFDVREGAVSILVKKVGSGSAWLSVRRVGEELDILGPLGRGFSLPPAVRTVLVAGGAGIAALRLLARRQSMRGEEPMLLWGLERRGEYAELTEVIGAAHELRVATMDGSQGYGGSVKELLQATDLEGVEYMAACGPRAMLLDIVSSTLDREWGGFQVSMEERMACGIGACRGCAVPATTVKSGYLMACRDGPVFDREEIDWKRIRAWV